MIKSEWEWNLPRQEGKRKERRIGPEMPEKNELESPTMKIHVK